MFHNPRPRNDFNDCLVDVYNPHAMYRPQHSTLNPSMPQQAPIAGVQSSAPDPVELVAPKKRKNREIEGDTIPEITNSIISIKPPMTKLRKAMREIVEMLEEEREMNFDLHFQ